MITYDKLATIIPSDQALANKALATSLQQITGISNMSLPTFAAAVSATQTMVGLPLVNAQTAAVSPATAEFYANAVAGGSGINGTFVICDFLGIAAGLPGTEQLTNVLAQFAKMNLSTLTLIYQQMAAAADGSLGDTEAGPIVIASGPAAGSYVGTEIPPVPPAVLPTYDPSALDQAMAALIAAANTEISNLTATYPAATASINASWNTIAQALTTEPVLQAKANLVFADLTANSQQSVLALIQSLPEIGKDSAVGGQAQFFEALADMTTLGGQAIVGLFRQGVTAQALNAAGIYTNNNIPSDPSTLPPQADLGPTTYPSP